jgi:hypothetical protein
MDLKKELKDYFTPREGASENAQIAGLFTVEKVLYFLFKTPYELWLMSCVYLRNLREQKRLNISDIGGIVPFMIFLVRFIFEFLPHALIFLSVVLAPIAAIVGGLAETDFSTFLGTLAAMYYAPLAIRLVIETINLIIKYASYIKMALIFILKYPFMVLLLIYHFFDYLQKKCSFKADKYDIRKAELHKDEKK